MTNLNFVVTPASRDFSSVLTGTIPAQLSFVVTNGSGVTLNGTAVVGGAPFLITSGSPFSIASLGSTNVVVRFAPVSTGKSSTDQVVFATNIGNTTNPVMGAGAALPVASFTGSPTTGLVPVLVTFTDTSTGTITNRFWTFGDGGTTNTPNTTVAYTYNAAGTDTVTLVVTGPLGASTNARINYIIVTNIPPQEVVFPGSRAYGVVVAGQSTTQTFSVVNAGLQTLTGSATVGAPFAIESGSPFTISGGRARTSECELQSVTNGTFNGSVFFSSNGSVSTNAVSGTGVLTNASPVAAFNAAPTSGAAPLQVNFTDALIGTITNHSWTFGDGGVSILKQPESHVLQPGRLLGHVYGHGPAGIQYDQPSEFDYGDQLA